MKALLAKQKMINKVVLIPEHRIKPNPYQPRRVFDQEKIEQLAASIAQYGLLQPITVLPLEDGSYQLVAGERRLLACRRLRMQEVPAILTTMDEERSSALALVENIQRCDLNFFEEAAAIQKLMKMGGYTQQAVAKKLGKNQSTIANKLRLLQFSEPVREAILAANLTERHARALLNLNEQGGRAAPAGDQGDSGAGDERRAGRKIHRPAGGQTGQAQGKTAVYRQGSAHLFKQHR